MSKLPLIYRRVGKYWKEEILAFSHPKEIRLAKINAQIKFLIQTKLKNSLAAKINKKYNNTKNRRHNKKKKIFLIKKKK